MLTQIAGVRETSITPGTIAFGRVFNGPATYWLPGDLPLLDLWPSHRRLAGYKIQFAVLARLESKDWNEVVIRSLTRDFLDWQTEVVPLARELVASLLQDFPPGPHKAFRTTQMENLIKIVCSTASRIIGSNLTSKEFFRQWFSAFFACLSASNEPATASIQNWGIGHVSRWVKDYPIHLFKPIKSTYPYSLNDPPSFEAETWAALMDGITTLAGVDLFCRHLASSNSDLRIKNPSDFEPHRWIGRCLRGEKPRATKKVLPIWQALGQYLARRDVSADRELLEHAAREPESYPEPLRFGLQFIVRDDIMRDDGSTITLDELSNEVGLEPLPMIDPMPPVEMDYLVMDSVEQALAQPTERKA
jgi:hypothetical protein